MPRDFNFNERYAQGETPWDSGRPSSELVNALNSGRLKGKTVLEIGCGTGANAVELAKRGFEVTAVDLVAQAVEAARKRIKAGQVEVDLRVADVLKDDLGGPYDILFDRGVYHVLRLIDLKKFQDVLKRVTHPGSVWLSLAGNANEKESEQGPPVVHEHEIRKELEPLFEITELREFRFDTNQTGFRPLGWVILARRK